MQRRKQSVCQFVFSTGDGIFPNSLHYNPPISLVLLGYGVYKLIRRHVFKIREPVKNFILDKRVKCRSGKEEDQISFDEV